MPRSKSMIVAMTDIRMAMDVRFVKWGLIGVSAFGPIMVSLLIAGSAAFMPLGPDYQILMGIMLPTASTMLAMFCVIPASMIAANALVGEREQNTLEPLLCTPLTDRELLWGKVLSSLLPTIVLLASGTAISSVVIALVLLLLNKPIIIFPDLPGLFVIAVVGPLVALAMVSIMIIISGKVRRVYEAYQTVAGMVLLFFIPMMGPLAFIGSGPPSVGQTWFFNLITFMIAITLAIISWTIAIGRFNRDRMITMV